MIIVVTQELPVGETLRGLCDGEGTFHPDVAFRVLRVATKDDYRHWCRANGNPLKSSRTYPGDFFYEVSVD